MNPLKPQIFKHGTLFFSRDTPNISTVIPAMDHIDEYLATASQNVKYSEAIRAALALGKRTLNRYYDKTDHSEVYRIAMGKFVMSVFFHFSSTLSSSSPPSPQAKLLQESRMGGRLDRDCTRHCPCRVRPDIRVYGCQRQRLGL